MMEKIKNPKKVLTKAVNVQYSAKYNFDKVSFKANRDFIFFWSNNRIEYYPLDKPIQDSNKLKVALEISEKEKNSSIKFVDCAPNKPTLAIVIENVQTSTVI